MARHESSERKQQKTNRRPAGEPDGEPDQLQTGGRRLPADAARGQQLGADTDGIDGDMQRQPRR